MNTWSVWVGGIEVVDYLTSHETALEIAGHYIANGYTDVQIEEDN
jgi:hypothetical protein